MPDNRNRKRPIQVKFFVDEKEQALIKKKMAQVGIEEIKKNQEEIYEGIRQILFSFSKIK
ncbi:MAG: hypothetical protein SOY17_12560 [Evtepia sp.]|nr:hypothetical protein [Evtepia sp.]